MVVACKEGGPFEGVPTVSGAPAQGKGKYAQAYFFAEKAKDPGE